MKTSLFVRLIIPWLSTYHKHKQELASNTIISHKSMGLKSAFPLWALRFGCSSKKKAEDGKAGIDGMKTTGHTLDNSATNSSEGDVAGTARAEVHDQHYVENNCRPQPPSMQRQSSTLSVQDSICLTTRKPSLKRISVHPSLEYCDWTTITLQQLEILVSRTNFNYQMIPQTRI